MPPARRAEPAAQPGARPTPSSTRSSRCSWSPAPGQTHRRPDLVVAAEKAGLVYGHMNIFHRLVDNHPELGPIFSVANLVKPAPST
jgi:cell division protein ZipA